MKRLFLLDGMALIYRAHFALIQNPIRNSKGVNTSALYGFINTLLAIIEKEQPTHLGVAFDTSAPTARHLKFPAYKAQRDEMPTELADAIPHVKNLCHAFSIPVLELDGYEADDIIGTLVRKAEAADFESFMVTPDKDFAQLISPKISMWKPGRKGSDHEVIDHEKMLSNWGVERAEQVIDILGLWGDAADNIPGMPGVGEVTAKKFIAQFGSIENLIANQHLLKGKQKETVATYGDQALLSKGLATIIIDVPLDVSWEALEISQRDDDALRALLNEFEFRTLTKRLFPNNQESSPAEATTQPAFFDAFKTIHQVPHEYHLADTIEKRALLFSLLEKQTSFCFDIETTGLDRFEAKLLGIAFAWKAHEAWYLPWDGSPELRAQLGPIFSNNAEKIGHHLKFDLSILHYHQLHVCGPFFDTMLADMLAAPDRKHTMNYLAETLLGYSPIKLSEIAAAPQVATDDLFVFSAQQKASKHLDMTAIPLEKLAEYAAEDADVTFQLAQKIRQLLEDANLTSINKSIEAPLLPVLVRMEMEGIAIDPNALGDISNDMQHQIYQLEKSIHQHAGTPFNIASPKQLGSILFDHLKLGEKAKKTKTGQYKTDEATLSGMLGKHPIIEDILAWREASKLKSTYLDALPSHVVAETGRVHTHFHQLVAATGRLASSDPNLQNIPIRSEVGRKIRAAFVPRSGYVMLSCDYSQIELRIMAALANDATMIAAFQNHIDIHSTTAAKVFGVGLTEVTSEMRRRAKMVNFGIIYGISSFGLSQRLGIPRAEASEMIDAYFREYPAIRQYMEQTVETTRSNGFAETLLGRRRKFPDLLSSNQNLRTNAERAAINMPIQGTAADMIKLAMVRIDEMIHSSQSRSRMLLQVHDELVFDLHPEEEATLVPKILEAMKTSLPLPHGVPIDVEMGTGSNWLQAH